jgi:signal transduction histidine kinase
VSRARSLAGSTLSGPDLLLAVGLLAVVVLESRQPERFPAGGPLHWLPASAVATLALAYRRSHPIAVLGVSLAALFVQSTWLGFPESAGLFVALLVATASAAAHEESRERGLALAGLVVVVPWAMSRDPSNTSVVSVLPTVLLVAAAWGAGASVRTRRERAVLAEQQAAAATRAAALAAADERLRIARELHDTVAHGLSVVVVQTSMARLAWERGDPQVGGALVAVERAGREALSELRQLVDVLRPDGEQLPADGGRRLRNLPALLDGVRDTGVAVRLCDEANLADAGLPVVVEHSVYRIVQEALTNVVKHVGPTTATVRIARVPEGVQVVVEDDGPGSAGRVPVRGGGAGHVGLRERVAALGGTLHVGPRSRGGYTVVATLPDRPVAR